MPHTVQSLQPKINSYFVIRINKSETLGILRSVNQNNTAIFTTRLFPNGIIIVFDDIVCERPTQSNLAPKRAESYLAVAQKGIAKQEKSLESYIRFILNQKVIVPLDPFAKFKLNQVHFPITAHMLITIGQQLADKVRIIEDIKELAWAVLKHATGLIMADLTIIREALKQPNNVIQANSQVGGLAGISHALDPLLIKTSLLVSKVETFYQANSVLLDSNINTSVTIVVNKSLDFTRMAYLGNKIAEVRKSQLAYRKLYSGKKWNKAGLTKLPALTNKVNYSEQYQTNLTNALKDAKFQNSNNLKLASSVAQAGLPQNPIQALSKNNIEQLIAKLTIKGSGFQGLLPDEIALYKDMLDFPYVLIHATNYWYPIENNGHLKSLAEIWRTDPKFQSEFSTSGNVESLGNDGFAFFRLSADTDAAIDTRYGKTEIRMSPQLLSAKKSLIKGWISLYDQLVPLSSSTMQGIYFDMDTGNLVPPRDRKHKHLLVRNVKAVAAPNSKVKKPAPGDKVFLQYTYYDGTKEKKTLSIENVNMTNQVFYGGDIPRGISLSLIYVLRKFAPAIRAKILTVHNAIKDQKQRHAYLGNLLFKLFRPEAKFPSSINFSQQQSYLKEIKNPSGDGRYQAGATVNPELMKAAKHLEQLKQAETNLAIVRKNRGAYKSLIKKNSNKKLPFLELEAEKINLPQLISNFIKLIEKDLEKMTGYKTATLLYKAIATDFQLLYKKLSFLNEQALYYAEKYPLRNKLLLFFAKIFEEIRLKEEIKFLEQTSSQPSKLLDEHLKAKQNDKLQKLYQVKSSPNSLGNKSGSSKLVDNFTSRYNLYIDDRLVTIEQYDIARDGDCYFNSILFRLSPGEQQRLWTRYDQAEGSSVQRLRQIVADHLSLHEVNYVNFVAAPLQRRHAVFLQLVNNLKRAGVWANQLMDIAVPALADAIAQAIGRRIIIYDSLRHFSNSYGDPRDVNPIIVIYNGYSHYDGAVII